MYLAKLGPLNLLSVLLVCSLSSPAKDACNLRPLMDQRRDAATVQHLEDEWSRAYLRGDTGLERCLLAPDFTEILRGGEVKGLQDELDLAAKNQGKNLPIPDLPKTTVLLHGNVAVAYGMSSSTSNGKLKTTRFADSYLWEHGNWHVFFAQQTAIENVPAAPPSAGSP
jgi:hypothetical protein